MMATAEATRRITERRSSPRLPARVPVMVWLPESTVPARSRDISSAGIRLRIIAHHSFRVGDVYRIEIMTPTEAGQIRTLARVVRIITKPRSSGRWEIGLQFEGMETEDRARLARFLRLEAERANNQAAE